MDRQSTACERARLWASLAVDSEASELERVSLRAHVEACPECAAYASEVIAAARALQEAPLAQPTLSAWRAEHRSSEHQPGKARHRRLLLAAAAVAASLVVGGSIGRLTSPGHQPARSDSRGSSWMFYTAYQSAPEANLKARLGGAFPS